MAHPPGNITLDRTRAEGVFLGLVALVAAGVVLAAAYLPPAIDWEQVYVPASRAVLAGRSPYTVAGFMNPPWALLPLLPFGADPVAGRAGLFVLSLTVYALVAIRLEAAPVALGLFLVSPTVLHTLLNGNLEWLVLLGILLPPRWGLVLMVIKPQVGAGVAVWWAAEAWRAGGWHGVIILVSPVGVALATSLVLFGLWPLQVGDPPGLAWNASPWPWGLPLGLGVLVYSVWKRDVRAALIAAPLCSPYVIQHAWTGAVLALVGRTWVLAFVVVGLWGLVLLAAL
jgi:hypothetical protein